ncbi:uncharacterized protein LOC122368766 [Amphibalanus amphitrite]|uniref:uncharacterized protein LOC122368766 n=1 Tax=Amphibalanus amphitrite TaxID=1232801 RepID=UPI001C925646|nr:uncharacterized protein LOC122368766 [Amphibalanus amphitrite]
MRKITVISLMLLFAAVATGQSLDLCPDEEEEPFCPESYSECDGVCYQDTFIRAGDGFNLQCTGEGQFLPTPTTVEQLQCLLDIVDDGTAAVATGFTNKGDRFETEGPVGTTITAPQEFEGTIGPDPNEDTCVALIRNEVKLNPFECDHVFVGFVCQIAPVE